MSHLASYYKERFGHHTIENDDGFICYSLNPPEAWVEEFYIVPEKRCTFAAKKLADMAVAEAKLNKCIRIWAKVQPGAIGADHAMRTNLHYGFRLVCNQGVDTLMVKNIEE